MYHKNPSKKCRTTRLVVATLVQLRNPGVVEARERMTTAGEILVRIF